MDEVHVRASNVQSFTDITAFRNAIQAIPGAMTVRLVPAGSGTIEAVVEYDGVLPFEVYLKQLQTAAQSKRIPAHITVAVS